MGCAKLKKTALFVATFLVCALEASAQTKYRPREFELRAELPAFWKLVRHDAKLETVASGFGFTEGPVWDKAGFVYISDEEINKIYRVYPDGHKEELIALGDPDGSTFDRRESRRHAIGKDRSGGRPESESGAVVRQAPLRE